MALRLHSLENGIVSNYPSCSVPWCEVVYAILFLYAGKSFHLLMFCSVKIMINVPDP